MATPVRKSFLSLRMASYTDQQKAEVIRSKNSFFWNNF